MEHPSNLPSPNWPHTPTLSPNLDWTFTTTPDQPLGSPAQSANPNSSQLICVHATASTPVLHL